MHVKSHDQTIWNLSLQPFLAGCADLHFILQVFSALSVALPTDLYDCIVSLAHTHITDEHEN